MNDILITNNDLYLLHKIKIFFIKKIKVVDMNAKTILRNAKTILRNDLRNTRTILRNAKTILEKVY